MFAKIVLGLVVALPIGCMEKTQEKPAAQTKAIQSEAVAYSDQDREAIISMIATLKQGHLLFPIGDSVFRASIKHALLDSKDLLPQGGIQTVDEVVTAALANLARTIKQTCPRKDFLDSVDMILEQIDDRYNEEAKPLLRCAHNIKADKSGPLTSATMMELAYAVVHYEQFNQKDLKNMVHLHKRAPEMLQDKLQHLLADTVQKWYAEFMKDEQAS